MADIPLLSDLCRICNNNTPKYCCPRCKCLTCSLPCYKRHQTWSQCSGKRDPAAYMKRSQLATPAGIDHDYNFLTGIERAFDAADRDAESRGIVLEPRPKKDTTAARRLQHLLQDSKVIVKRAPKGMSRQRDNHTQCRNVLGLRNCTDDDSIENAYHSLFKDKAVSRSRKRKSDGKTKPCDRDEELQRTLNAQAQDNTRAERNILAPTTEPIPEISLGHDQSDESKTPTEHLSNVESIKQTSGDTLDSGDQSNPAEVTSQPAVDNDVESKATPNASPSDATTTKPEAAHPKLHFYLHRPLSTSSCQILIPLSSSATLRHSLANQTVLEFPTIHVLHEAPTALPQGMQLERDYVRQAKQMVKELDEELKDFAGEGYRFVGGEGHQPERDDAGFDESRVLETLKRDVAGVHKDSVD